MESRGHGKTRTAQVEPTGFKCQLCDGPIYNVCEHCSGLTTNDGTAAHCPRPNQRADLAKINNEKKPQGAVGNSESPFRSMLREGNKIFGMVTRNVVSATDHLFGIEEEEDIDQVVEEYKKAQLEEKK